MYINEEYITKMFEEQILPEFVRFVYKQKRSNIEKGQLEGELFTKIRRYLPDFVTPSDYNFSKNNIEPIGISWNGEITKISFRTHYTASDGKKIQELVNLFNKIVNNTDFNFEVSHFEQQLEESIHTIEYL